MVVLNAARTRHSYTCTKPIPIAFGSYKLEQNPVMTALTSIHKQFGIVIQAVDHDVYAAVVVDVSKRSAPMRCLQTERIASLGCHIAEGHVAVVSQKAILQLVR